MMGDCIRISPHTVSICSGGVGEEDEAKDAVEIFAKEGARSDPFRPLSSPERGRL